METRMGLKVDLKCHKCYKKVKKILCKFPQIRDQKYDEKHDMVTITVVCCNPEKLRDKICCKGGGIIKSIKILEPPKLDQNPPPSVSLKAPATRAAVPVPPPKTAPAVRAPPVPAPPVPAPWIRAPAPASAPAPSTPAVVPAPVEVSIGVCVHGYGGLPPCYYCSYGRPYVCHCWNEYLLCEENTSGCSVM